MSAEGHDGTDAEVARLRLEIDAIDDALVPLLEARVRVALALGAVKRTAGRPLRDEAREASVKARLSERLELLTPQDLERVYATLMALCLDVQERATSRQTGPLG